jgi:transposase
MGGDSKKRELKISKEQINILYKAGPDAILSLITYLQTLYNDLVNKVEAQQRIIEEQEKRIKQLEETTHKDSHNSNKPPSSDGFRRKNVEKSKKSRKKQGGQNGHEGKTLRMVSNPDKIEVHEVKECKKCGQPLNRVRASGYEKRQVFDLPQEIKIIVTD